ncbi:MAG: hypothetical protein HGJ97_19715 [Desulfosporosinus sp.]|nr:hypothetical protein [Desulfosporosinus sp.]
MDRTFSNIKIVWFVLIVAGFFFFNSNTAIASDGSAQFSWLPNTESNLIRYEIHYGLANGGPYPNVVNIGKPAPVGGRIHGEVTGLIDGQQYCFVCVAVDDQERKSDYSAQVAVTLGLDAPTNVEIIPAE